LPGIKFADLRFNRLSLSVLALFLSHPVVAEESRPIIHTLEWSNAAAGSASDSVSAEASQDDVWQRLRGGFKIDDSAQPNPLVAVHESWFAARPTTVKRLAERARPYLYHIVEEVQRRDMPMEIALLPMIESAFVSTALSRSAASGIWQFIPSTGTLYGLRQDKWYDGRRDFTAATNAALDYLGKLYLDFGDWQLALAAYNCGEGCIARAIQKNVQQGLPTDYASLSLPNETRHYVPKLLALKNLIHAPENYGIAIEQLPNQPYFNQVTVHASMDLHSAARLANMSSDEFAALNAAFPRKLIRSDTPVNLLVPVDKADTFQRNLETGNWDSWQPYTAQKGERPEAIAKRFGISVDRLLEHNPVSLKRGKLQRTQTILVPVNRRGGSMTEAHASDATQHVVQGGDTLFNIARRYGLAIAQLNAANPELDRPIQAGQTLRLTSKESAGRDTRAIQPVSFKASIETDKPVQYTVQRGDTLFGIAQRFEVGMADIKAWNPALGQISTIRAGQTLVVNQP
jgi:membrane-bound lytic murein transglycosylase D